jgi:peptidoglycan hydrolase-like protein with peptidoglycan-binding domain
MCVVATACGNATTQQTIDVFSVAPSRAPDDRTLEEKVDTDGDGEMSEDEVQTYARAVLLDFSDCMRDNGYPDFTDVVLEDFTEGGGGQGRFIALMAERGVTLPEGVPTLQSCGESLADLQTFAPQPSDDEVAEQEALVLEFAACMRTTGVDDWPDPDFAANSGPNGYGPELLDAVDIQSDEVQEAIATCQAENSGVTIGQESGGDEAASNSSEDQATEPSEDITRAPISPLIDGDTSDLNLAQVTRRDLVQTKSLAGTLGYGEQRPFPTNTTGIVTALPAEGDVIGFGEVLFHIDNEPVLLLEGSIPQFRRFTSNMGDGADVEQLEQNLERFGYADDFDLTVDQDFTVVTRDVVEEFQLQLGIGDTGRIELGRVVFSSTPVRIGEVHVELGQTVSPQNTLVSVTDSEQRIVVDLDAEDRSLVSTGTAVDIELPDGTVVAGTVSAVAAVATRSVNQQNGASEDPTIEVTVGFSGNPPEDVFDAAPVDIIVTDEVTSDVLTVPVPSLVAVSGGGHAVELVVDGGTQLIGVELGDFVDEIVEVRGDLQEGDSVVLGAAG